jgi:hypothetical protein
MQVSEEVLTMYTLYKKVNDTESILAYCDDPMECAQAIRVDAEICDDDAEYRWEDDGTEEAIR